MPASPPTGAKGPADPTTGFAPITYADDYKVNQLRVANQVSGPNILGR
jgi:hypothetical protein